MSAFDDYESYDALGLAALVAEGRVSAADALEAAIERALRHAELNAIPIPMYEEARALAVGALPEGPFRGVPFLLKDLYAAHKGWRLTNGSRIFADHVSDHDHALVTRYKAAGLVCFGRSASPEFGITTSTESVLFGATRNPWNRNHSAGGSSARQVHGPYRTQIVLRYCAGHVDYGTLLGQSIAHTPAPTVCLHLIEDRNRNA